MKLRNKQKKKRKTISIYIYLYVKRIKEEEKKESGKQIVICWGLTVVSCEEQKRVDEKMN